MLDNGFIIRYKTIPAARHVSRMDESPEPYIQTALHNHREFEILHIDEGSARVTVDRHSFTAERGDIVLISPFLPHMVEVSAHTPFGLSCICFDLSLVSNRELAEKMERNRLSVIDHIRADYEHREALHRYFVQADRAIKSEGTYWEMEVQGSLILIFSYLGRNGLFIKAKPYSGETRFCLGVLKFLDEHYMEKISSGDAAEELHYDRSYFCRAFRKSFGLRFSDYLCFVRISKAKILLSRDEKSVTEIAGEVGFSGASYFIRCFKEQTGVSPKEYRRMQNDECRMQN